MDIFRDYKLHKEADGYTLILYLTQNQTEFAEEISKYNSSKNKDLNQNIEDYVKLKFPNIKIKLVKVMIGSMLIASFTLNAPPVQALEISTTSYKVVSGDSLSVIAKRFNTTVYDIKTLNNLSTDIIYPNQILKIPTQSSTATYTNYTVISGDSLYAIASRFNTTVADIQRINGLTSSIIYVGQILKIPSVQTTTPTPTINTTTYKVVAGDSLWGIAVKYTTTVDKLKNLNNLTTTTIFVGQALVVPLTQTEPTPNTTNPPPVTTSTTPTVSYINHTVASGENIWSISIRYGIPMSELLRVNNFTESTVLSIGQIIRVPVHTIPVTGVPSPQYGEYLDWWTQAQYLFPINQTARVIDFQTGKSFNVKRTIGANHSDTEPLTSNDAAIIKEIWGGTYSWKTRAVIVEVNNRRIAASMTSMPHGIEYIEPNSFDGHFDIHFLNSTRHSDGLVDPYHQAQVKIAAGI